MGGMIQRYAKTFSMGIANNASVTSTGGFSTPGDLPADGIMDVSGFAYGSVTTPTTWTAADITFTCLDSRAGTYVPVYDKTGALVRITTVATAAAQSYELPSQVFMCGPFVKINSTNTASTAAVNQSGAKTLTVRLGS